MHTQNRRVGDAPDRAVSPVIGIILMVAITVILAAVAGTMFLVFADDVAETAPTASVTVGDHPEEYDESRNDGGSGEQSTLLLEHHGGEQLDSELLRIELRIVGDNALVAEWNGSTWTNHSVAEDGSGIRDSVNGGPGLADSDVLRNGDQITIVAMEGNDEKWPLEDDTEYRITVFDTESGDPIAEETETVR